MSLRRRPVARAVRSPPLPHDLHSLHLVDLHKPRVPVPPDPNPHQHNDSLITAILTLAALATRFFRIHQPKAVVFDELHFGAFLENHLHRQVSRNPLHCQFLPSRLTHLGNLLT